MFSMGRANDNGRPVVAKGHIILPVRYDDKRDMNSTSTKQANVNIY